MENSITTTPTASSQRQPVPAIIMERYKTFQNLQRFWFGIHYLSGIIAIIAGCLATAAGAKSTPDFIQNAAWMWGLLAALLSGVVTFLGPLQKAESYKHAYYRLASSITRYETGFIDMKKLLDDYENSQSIVLLGDPTVGKKLEDGK